MLAAAGAAIVEGVERSGPGWAARRVEEILDAWGRVEDARRADVRLAAERAGAQVTVLDGLGHWWMLEDPQRGAAAVAAWLDQVT